MDKTATPIGASAELLPSSQPARIDGDTGSGTKSGDAAIGGIDFFDALVGTVIEIGQLSVFP